MFKNRLDQTFERLEKQGRKALIAYLAAGYPDTREQEPMILAMREAGVDILEVGIPFSDPIADGPTIQFASQESLKAGTTLRDTLKWLRGFHAKADLPLVIMSYLNPILQFGLDAFAKEAGEAGVAGVIVPDTIPEETEEIKAALAARNIHLIFLVAPTTPKDRQKAIAKATGGFLYAVSVTGVTGARTALPTETKAWLASLQKLSSNPVCVGFGISGPAQVRELRDSVNGFIVGSALIDIIRKNEPGRRVEPIREFVKGLAEECSRGR